MTHYLRHTLVAAAVLLLIAPPALAQAPSAEAIVKAFGAVESDPIPETVGHQHFVASNENLVHLFRPTLTGLGGVYIGVGTDQNYMMAGWSRPDVMVLMDYDRVIVALQDVYRACFLAADSPAGFMAFWMRDAKQKMTDLLKKTYADDAPRHKLALQAYEIGRHSVRKRLKHLRAWSKNSAAKRNFTSDQGDYDHLRTMWQQGRIIAMGGDLMGDKTIKQLAAAATKLGLPIRTLYMSNAEQYQRRTYHPKFIANMLALPFDDKGVVLRTMPSVRRPGHSGDMWYYIQPGKNFHVWLKTGKAKSVWSLLSFPPAKPSKANYLLRHIRKLPRKYKAEESAKAAPESKEPVGSK